MRPIAAASARGAVTTGMAGSTKLRNGSKSVDTNSKPDGRQRLEPGWKFHDRFFHDAFERRVVDCAVNFAAARVEHRRAQRRRPEKRQRPQVRNRDHGFAVASARPFAAASPTRTPVNEPGPDAAAKQSI